MENSEISWTSHCDSYSDSYFGKIETLDYPGNYPPNQKCFWRVKAPIDDFSYHLIFEDFQIQSSCEDGNDTVSLILVCKIFQNFVKFWFVKF